MPALTETHFQRLLDHARQTLLDREHYYQDRDPHYREVLTLVEDLADLLLEVRRDRAALEEIVRIGDDCEARCRDGARPDGDDSLLRMGDVARRALGLPARTVATVELRGLAPIETAAAPAG